MTLVTVYTNGQIMLPAEIRQRLDIKQGDALAFFITDSREIIMCKTTAIQAVLKSHAHEREEKERARQLTPV